MFLDSVVRRISEFVTSSGAHPAVTIDAHASLARSLTNKMVIAADPSGALARLAVLTPPESAPAANASAALGYVRTRPVQGAFDALAAPAWAHGMAVAHTAGPFFDEHGIASWIDTMLPAAKQIAIVRGLGGPTIAYVQAAYVTETRVQTGSTVTLGPGSVWFPAPLLAKTAPANGFAGIAFSSATLSVPDGILPSATGTVYTIGQNVTVDFDLAPLAAPPPPPGAANDAAGALAALPTKVHFALAPAGIHATAMDNAALTAYGVTALLAGGVASVSYDSELAEIAFAYGAVTSPATFTVGASMSPTFTLRGTAPVLRGTYRIPVAQTSASALGPAASGGALGLALGTGMTGRWGNLDEPVRFASTLLHLQSGVLGIVGHTMRRPFRDTYELWDARATAGHPPRATSISLVGSRGTLVLEGESAAGEIVIAMGCGVEANIDRPLLATGSAPSLARIVAGYTLVHAGADTTLLIEGVSVPLPLPPGHEPPPKTLASFVIENAVLRTTGVDALVAYGKLTGLRATQGVVFLGNALERVIPILPDPYASNIDLRQEVVAETLVAITAWASPPDPHLAFAILRPPQSNGATNLAAFDANATFANNNRLARGEGGIGELYDVSSAQNQFGVALTAQALAQSQIFGQQLAVTAQQSGLFTVPAISWEPVLDIGRSWFFPISADDGPPAVVVVPTVALRPLEPAAFYDAFLADYAKGADLIANLTLPFGLTATVDTRAQANTQPPIPRPELHAIEPKFPDDRTGGKQLSIQGVYDATNQRTVLPGSSRADTPYVEDMLSQGPAHVVANMWDEDFGGQPVVGAVTTHFVPVSRYDLSGYGATTFSDFQYLGEETGITEARFDVIVGRTLYELVEAQSYILPWYIPVINTTIFSRDATGYVNRFNTGWRAKTDGTFKFPNGAAEIEHGGVVGVFNIRNIVEGAEEIVALRKYVRVTFDADVQIVVDPALHGLKVTGGNPSGRIPSRGLTGYLVADAKDKPDIAESIRVLDALGPAVGPIAAEVDVNETGIAIGLTGVEITATRPDVVRVNPAFPRTIAASLRGTPRLPRDGSWSVAMRAGTSAVPQPIPPTTPVPLIRANADPATWRIADGADVVKLDAPLHFYGILQATGANKVFFEHPTIRKIAGTNPLNFDKSPKLADVGKLLGDNGLLPDVLSLLDFGGFDGLAKSGDGFALKKTLKNSVDLGSRTLIPLSIIRLVMTSWSDPPGQPKPTEITLDLDPTGSPRWAIAIKNIAFKLVVDGWGGDADPLITVHGDASAHDGAAPTFSNLGVKYGESLSVVKSILTEIEQFISFLPGMKGAGLDVSFAGSKLRVREAFPLPKLPLGLGYLEDISLDLGFDVDVLEKKLGFFISLGDDQNPFHWLVSPLSGNGMLQLGCSDKMGVKMQAGIGLGLAIDFAIVSGSASIVIAVQFDATSSPIGVMVLLTGQASVDVLDGLASASLTLTAGLGIKVSPGDPLLLLEVPPDPIEFLKETTVTLMAEVAVGIHISVCWLVHIDFDGSWPFSETISGKTLAALV